MPNKTLEFTPPEPIPSHLISQVKSKLAYVDELIAGVEITESGDEIIFQLKPSTHNLDTAVLATLNEKVQYVVTEMTKGSYQPKVEVLEDFRKISTPHQKDPLDELIALGEVSKEEIGIFTFGPLFSSLVDYFESRFLELAASINAKTYRFPTLMSAKMLDRVDYFSAFPHSLTFATHLREDLDVINNFAEVAAYEEDGLNASMESFSRIQAMLSPAVCYHLYFSLADRTLPTESIIATAVGNCFRYESTNLTSLERLWNFTMREVIFVGSKDFVLEKREQARDFMRPIFEELGLAYHVESANDPFFVGEFRKQAAFQNAFQLKYEIRARLPFKDDSLAIGSYNYHQDFFGRNLNINLPDGTPLHTACAAFGLERTVFAFLSQYGLNQIDWPEAVNKDLK
ncbi:MAG: hypothetical protein N2C13_05555 [Chloroflexota bacterium]